jgi:glycerate 2-kinase
MPLKVLIAPDKFKGTLTARQAARAIARGWRRVRPRDSVCQLPVTDGGDGFGEIMSALLAARMQSVRTCDAARRPVTARWWYESGTRTAVVESARAIGLAMLPPDRFHPFELDTAGLAAVLQAAGRTGAARCWLGIGGSATNDGGFGMARALGWEFFDRAGDRIERWTDLPRLASLRAPRRRRWFKQLLVAVDVQNPLLGPRGATRVYGPQKGLSRQDFKPAESCLRQLARVARRTFGHDYAAEPGAGAAGGLGFGLRVFLGARLVPGFDWFARRAALEHHLHSADLVITGEGAMDASTFMGKAAGRIAERCRQLKIPCIGLAGQIDATVKRKRLFARMHALTDLTTLEQAKARPAYWLERSAAEAAGIWIAVAERRATPLFDFGQGFQSGVALRFPPQSKIGGCSMATHSSSVVSFCEERL